MTERFELLEQLGRGGMGTVWKARDAETGEIVALKLLHSIYVDDPDYVERFEREVEIARRIDSPHVVKVLGFGRREGVPYVAMEYVAGETLRDRLKRAGPVSWEETKRIATQTAIALSAAHGAGVIHRDIKPSNVLLDSNDQVKLADFGIARATDLTRMTGSVTVLGTPAYMSPDGDASPQSDLYGLGCVLFELLVGSPPFEGESQQQVLLKHIRQAPDLERLPSGARKVVGWLLEKDPKRRPQTADALLAVLTGSSGGGGVVRVPSRRRTGRWVGVGMLGIAGLGLAGGMAVAAAALLGGDGGGEELQSAADDFAAAPLTARSTSAIPETPAPTRYEPTYLVREGDSCADIAGEFVISLAALIAVNFPPDGCLKLEVGQSVRVPQGHRCAQLLVVQAEYPQVGTRCFIEAGERVGITASGEWCLGVQAADERVCYSPNGALPEPWDTDLTLPGAPVGSLLARMGDGPWFVVGAAREFVAEQTGYLRLAVNDRATFYQDNHGEIDVAVAVLPSIAPSAAAPTPADTPTPLRTPPTQATVSPAFSTQVPPTAVPTPTATIVTSDISSCWEDRRAPDRLVLFCDVWAARPASFKVQFSAPAMLISGTSDGWSYTTNPSSENLMGSGRANALVYFSGCADDAIWRTEGYWVYLFANDTGEELVRNRFEKETFWC